jgi:plastocyanin
MRFSLASIALATFVSAANFTIHDLRLKSVPNSERVYLPDTVNAPVGDAIVFVFYPKNHTVMQPTFTAPCEPMYSGVNPDFEPVTANATNVPSFTIAVNQTTPLWFFCHKTG